MSDVGNLMDDFGSVPLSLCRKTIINYYEMSGLPVFRVESLYMPVCYVNNDCGVLAKRGNSLCAGCTFKFQRRLDERRVVRFSTVSVDIPKRKVVMQSLKVVDDRVLEAQVARVFKRASVKKPEEYLML